MDQMLRDLCKRHGLTCVSTIVYPDRVLVFLHWKSDLGNWCADGRGDTFDAAFADALKEMARLRGPVFTDDLPSTHDAYAAMGWDTSLRGKDQGNA